MPEQPAPISLYSSLSGSKESLSTLSPGEVRMYACGITVYDEAHLGHARQAIVFDIIRRYLEFRGYKVTYVRNFTDIDDKIIKRASERNMSALELSALYIRETRNDLDALKVEPATHEPTVSGSISQIISFIEELIQKGHAYVFEGDVLYDVRSYDGYGLLSHRKLEDCLNADESSGKRNPQDFALWKGAKPGEPSWESPWGPGRPGWHIECSAMAREYLGDELDIHGGGIDLLFPHHENERAQSEALTGKKFARYWVHNGLVNVNGQKMSKSLGNFLTIKDALRLYPVDVIRYAVLSLKYAAPMDFSDQAMRTALLRVHYSYRTLAATDEILSQNQPDLSSPEYSEGNKKSEEFISSVTSAMDDDFNTAAAIAALSVVLSAANEIIDSKRKIAQKASCLAPIRNALSEFASLFRIIDESPTAFLEALKDSALTARGLSRSSIEEKISERQAAKAAKDYARADSLRNELKSLGITLQDSPNGPTRWDLSFE